MLDVCLLGTGGMMPLPGRFLTSCLTRFNGSSLLIDCGEGTQVALRKKGFSCHDIDVIAFTHYHGDHISGLPGLLLSIGNSERTEPVTLVGPPGLETVVNALRIIAPELPFPLKFIELTTPKQQIEINGYRLEAFKARHNVTCYGYSQVILRAGKFDPQKAKKNNVPMCCWSKLQKGQTVEYEGKTYTQDMILGPERKGLKLTYCTDSRPTKLVTESAGGSDLFICEGMYGEKGSEAKAKEHSHMTFAEAAKIAKEAEVKELWLTHYSPALVRPEDFEENAREIFPNSHVCRDGRTVTLLFENEE
ncbi:MAG: ribonuclease Z [Lachnospiraceae bacterium]|nr:ribonuclease Z [Lachnospiraceae bacterium]